MRLYQKRESESWHRVCGLGPKGVRDIDTDWYYPFRLILISYVIFCDKFKKIILTIQ